MNLKNFAKKVLTKGLRKKALQLVLIAAFGWVGVTVSPALLVGASELAEVVYELSEDEE